MASDGSTAAREAAAGAMGQERTKMRKVLTRFDIVFFTIAAFISLDTIAVTAAYGGGETFFWLIVIAPRLARALRHDRRGARLHLPGGGRPLRVAAHGLRPPGRLRSPRSSTG